MDLAPRSRTRRRAQRLLATSVLAIASLGVSTLSVAAPTSGAARARSTSTAAGSAVSSTVATSTVASSTAASPIAAGSVVSRAINLNGPAILADGIAFEAGSAIGVSAGPRSFCNQTVPLVPATDAATAQMLRCSVWGSGTPGARVAVAGIANGTYDVGLYVWEDNATQTFTVLVNGATVTRVVSGSAGQWSRLGPFPVTVTDGTVTITTSGGSANLSGVVLSTPAPPNQPPVVTSPGDRTSRSGAAITPLQIVASDPDAGQTLTYSATGLPAGLAIDPATGVIAGTPTAVGTSSVTVTVADSAGPPATASATFSWVVEPGLYRAVNINGPAIVVGGVPFEAGSAPGVTAGPHRFCNQSVPLVPATDAATAQMVRCSVWGSGTPGAQVSMTGIPAGTYDVGLYVWEDNASSTFTVLMNGSAVARVVSGAAGTWRLLGPFPVTINDGTLAITTSGGSGNLSGLVVSGAGGTPPPANRPPVVTSPGDQAGVVGTAIAPLQVTASDPDAGQTLTYSATGLPAGLALDGATGVVSGTPTAAGTSSVTVTATDNGTPPASASATFSWVVTAGGGNPGGGTFDPTKVTDTFVAGGNWVKSLAADWLPDGTMLVLTEPGMVYRVTPSTGAQSLVLDISAGVFSGNESGALDILVDAAGTGFYLYYTVANSDRLRISHFTLGSTAEQVIWNNPGLGYNADHAVHLGGSLNLGPDGKLYLSIGDRYEGRSQDLTNVFGKVLRINTDGTVPTDNPFYDGAGPNVDEIWAYGFRNPYRGTFDKATGLLWVGDVGGNVDSQAYEEVNIVERGRNYGWPTCEGPLSGPKNGPLCPAGVTGPVFSYPHTIGAGCCQNKAIVGGDVYRGTVFPLVGQFLYADYPTDSFGRVALGADGRTAVDSGSLFQAGPSTPVWLQTGPDGYVYWLSLGFGGGGQLRKLGYTGATGSPPVITTASASPTTGAAPLTVSFAGAASDPDGTAVTYAWDFGDGGTSTAASPSHTYTANGTYQARLRVTSGGDTVSSNLITVVVGRPPTAQITSPPDGTVFEAGDVITVTGAGTDPDTGALPASALSWEVQFLHNDHAHPVTSGTGSSLVFAIPTDGHDFTGNTRYRVALTATDPDGLTTTTSILLWPHKTDVNLSSNAATTVTVDGVTQNLPHTIDTLVGFQHALTVPATQCVAGRTWTFQSWSDGGAREHTITVVPGLSLVATYADTGACAAVGTMKVSTASSRAGAVALEGANLAPTTPVYIFFENAVRITKVEFWLDQPVTTAPRHVESGQPWDFVGGTTSAATAFDPGTLAAGPHTITARVTLADGSQAVFDTRFTVGSA